MLGLFNTLLNSKQYWGEVADVIARDVAARNPLNSPQAKLAIATRYYEEILNAADLSVIDELMAEDFLFTIPTHPEPYRGPQGFKDLVTMLHGAFPDVHLAVQHLLVEGDTVVGHWLGSGTHTGGPLHTVAGDIPASGKGFVIDGMSWLKIVDGKIVESLANEDTLSLLTQIGVIPAPPEAAPLSSQALALKLFETAMNGKDLAILDHIIAPELTLHTSLLPEPVRGVAGLRQYFELWQAAFPDRQYTVTHHMGDKAMAGVRWLMQATHQGDFLGNSATGKTVNLQGIYLCRCLSGQIAEIWVNENDLGLIEQIRSA